MESRVVTLLGKQCLVLWSLQDNAKKDAKISYPMRHSLVALKITVICSFVPMGTKKKTAPALALEDRAYLVVSKFWI